MAQANTNPWAEDDLQNLGHMVSSPTSTIAGALDLTDEFIYQLAREVETIDHLDALGIALGVKRAAMTRYHDSNKLSGGFRGTREMLLDWRQETPGADKSKLKRALQRAGLNDLVKKFFEDVHIPREVMDRKPFDVGYLRRHLITHYKQELIHLPLRPWDADSHLCFERHFVEPDLYEQGHPCESDQETKSLDDLLKMASNEQDHHCRFAILASAGRGKSTLVLKIAYDWSHEVEGSPLQDIVLLFVITMRLLQEKTNLEDAIMSQLLAGDQKFTADDVREFIKENQSKCMLVLDGFDEYVGNALSKDIRSNIVSVLKNTFLQRCPMIVTSRFSHQRSFTKASLSYVKMELHGFTLENVRSYAKGFFNDQEERLLQFLDSCPVVRELMRTPLFCVMVCDLWKQEALEDVQTQTGLLNQVIQFLWHHLRAKNETDDEADESSYSSDEAESAYNSGDEDSEGLQTVLLKVGQVVLEQHLNDYKKTVFSRKDFKPLPNELKKACQMGLLSQRTVAETRIKVGKKTERSEYQFYHKLAQEHIASNYLVTLPPATLEETLSRIKDYRGIHRYENLLRFACGFGAVSCGHVLGHLLRQLWMDKPLPPNKNETFRLALDFLNECPEIDDAIREHLETIFKERYLCLHAATPSAILGLRKLPQTTKNKIGMIRIQSSEITESSCHEFCNVLPLFEELKHLGLRGVNVTEPSLISIVESARRCKTSKGVLFKFCNVRQDGPLHRYLVANKVEESPQNMRVLIFDDDGTRHTYFCTHTR